MKQVNIFLGGGVLLLEGNENHLGYRPTVIDPILSKLNSRRNARCFYIVKTYADLQNEYAPEGQQEHYNRYVRQKADIAIFIFDGKIGDKTKEEVENACNCFDRNKHPTIYFYGTNLKDSDEVVKYLNSKNQYYRHFSNKEELKQLIYEQLSQRKVQRSTLKCLLFILGVLALGWLYFYKFHSHIINLSLLGDSIMEQVDSISVNEKSKTVLVEQKDSFLGGKIVNDSVKPQDIYKQKHNDTNSNPKEIIDAKPKMREELQVYNFEDLKRMANTGDVRAYYPLAKLYYDDVAPDYEQVHIYAIKAIDANVDVDKAKRLIRNLLELGFYENNEKFKKPKL